jgi:hypothetical protein
MRLGCVVTSCKLVLVEGLIFPSEGNGVVKKLRRHVANFAAHICEMIFVFPWAFDCTSFVDLFILRIKGVLV